MVSTLEVNLRTHLHRAMCLPNESAFEVPKSSASTSCIPPLLSINILDLAKRIVNSSTYYSKTGMHFGVGGEKSHTSHQAYRPRVLRSLLRTP